MSEILDRLRTRRNTKQEQIANLQSEIEELDTAIIVIEREEGLQPSLRSVLPAHTNGNGHCAIPDSDEDERGTTAIVLETIAANAEKGIRSGDVIKAVLSERPNERVKYVYTVLSRQANKTRKVRRVGKRYFPADI